MGLFKNRSFFAIVIGFVLLVLVGGSIPFLLDALKTSEFWVRHTLEAQARLNQIRIGLQNVYIAQGRHFITGREAYLDTFAAASDALSSDVDALEKDISDNASQQALARQLHGVVQDFTMLLKTYIDRQKAGQFDEILRQLKSGDAEASIGRARALIGEMEEAESRLLMPRQMASQASLQTIQAFIYGLLVLIAAMAVLVVFDTRRRFKALQKTTHELEGSIAQERVLQDQLRQSQKMEAIGQLAGGIAHDFNNMLAVVISSLTLFKRRSERGESGSEQFVDSALEGANRAARLTHRLLAYSRQQPLSPQAIDANRLIADMSELLGRALGEEIRIETVLAGGLWKCFADWSQLENSILNLCINARDAMQGGGKLTIETANAYLDDAYARDHVDIPAGQYVMIAITDVGSGMSEEVIAKAFDPFFTTKEVGQGTGLGLSQVQGFVKQSGGHIKIYSELSHGTTIKIYLPRHHTDTALVLPTKSGASADTNRGKASEIILVLEDDARVRAMVVESLRELGYTVLHADHGAKALQMLDEHRGTVALLFTDVIMPELSGRKVAELALAKHPALKVVYTTGFSRNAIIHNGILNPGVDFIAKPFTLDALAEKIRTVLDQPVRSTKQE